MSLQHSSLCMYNSMQLDNSKLTLKIQVGYFILQWRYKDYVSESLYFSRINKGFCLSSNKGNNDNAAFTFQAKRASFLSPLRDICIVLRVLNDYSQDTIDEIDPWSRNLKNVLE